MNHPATRNAASFIARTAPALYDPIERALASIPNPDDQRALIDALLRLERTHEDVKRKARRPF